MEGPSLAVALDAGARATLLLALAGLASVGLKRASAAARHLVWTLGTVGALALPVLGSFAPAWELPLFPGEWRAPAAVPAGIAVAAPVDTLHPGPDAHAPKALIARALPAAGAARSAESPAATHRGAGGPAATLDRDALLGVAWLAGALVVLLPLGAGSTRLWWMTRRRPPASPAWSELAREVAESLGIRGPVALVRGERRAMPMAWGLLRPAILLPDDAEDWPEERRRSVLTHELAHVQRRDCLTQALAHVACAVYWFHPLAWLAARRMRAERERACDDLVLRAGAAGPDYADHLLQMARGLRAARHPALATVAMARPSQLEGRLLAILDPSVERRAPTLPRLAAGVALAAALVVALAGVQPWSRPVEAAPLLPGDADIPAARVATSLRGTGGPAVASPSPGAPPVAAPPAGPPALEPPPGAEPKSPAEPRQQQERVVQALTGALRDGDAEVRREAVFALGRLRATSAAAGIAEALADDDEEVRTQAAFALGQIGSPAVVGALAKAVTSDEEAEVRTQAAFALGQIAHASAVEALARTLATDREGEVRTQAAFALGQIRSPDDAAALGAAVGDSDAEVRKQAVFALGQVRDPAAVDPLAKALRDADTEVREQAAFALGQIGSAEALPALIEALGDGEAEVRVQAAFALGQIGDERAAEALAAAMKDADAEVRRQAAFALGQVTR